MKKEEKVSCDCEGCMSGLAGFLDELGEIKRLAEISMSMLSHAETPSKASDVVIYWGKALEYREQKADALYKQLQHCSGGLDEDETYKDVKEAVKKLVDSEQARDLIGIPSKCDYAIKSILHDLSGDVFDPFIPVKVVGLSP